ncbi:unnamed protein product [Haemonchus placei]|uniref:Peptidase_M13_N domain-containing protein n=1 Tax=Haemonchus placei TaxID=6290 RepID=A0A3P8ANI3_HAEPC|nr:unnamed protein product [Haemonchus placei]
MCIQSLFSVFSIFFYLTGQEIATYLSVKFSDSHSECTTQRCVRTAARLLSKMNPSVDPCIDFYDYACGQWINNSVNLNYPSWNVLYETNMRAHDKIVHAMLKGTSV